MTRYDADRLRDRAAELDGPGAIVSHAEVLDLHLAEPNISIQKGAASLAVSPSTVRRLRANLIAAGLLP